MANRSADDKDANASAKRRRTTAFDEGVFFSRDKLPIVGKQANKRSSEEQLKQAVQAWRTPFASCGALTPEQHAQFFTQGWVMVHDVIPKPLLEQAISSVESLVDSIAERLHAAGRIKDKCEGASFTSRLIRLEEQFPHASVLLHKNGVLPRGIQDVWSHPALVGIAAQILGQDVEIYGHPVWNLRCKTPETHSKGEATVPWHQDNAYLDEECWDKLQVTAWVPLVNTNANNGCMQVVDSAHSTGKTVNHACCVGGTWYVEALPEEFEATLGCDMKKDVVTCEVPLGSVLFLNNLIPHRSLPNYSDAVRWSLDLRWQRGGEPNGFSGIKESVLMKRPGDMGSYHGEIDWGSWATVDRNEKQKDALTTEQKAAVEEAGRAEGRFDGDPKLDTTIVGPWMHRWGKVLHQNRHTEAAAAAAPGSISWGQGFIKREQDGLVPQAVAS